MAVSSDWKWTSLDCRWSVSVRVCVNFTAKITWNKRPENFRDHIDAVKDFRTLSHNGAWFNGVPNFNWSVF
jgi:hypothetical protein